MYPILFSYKGIQISTYGLMLVIAFLTCNYLGRRYLTKKNLNPDIADDMTFRAAIGGILGSKIYYIIEFWSLEGYQNLIGLGNIFKGIVSFDLSLITEGLLSLSNEPINPPTYFIRDIFLLFCILAFFKKKSSYSPYRNILLELRIYIQRLCENNSLISFLS